MKIRHGYASYPAHTHISTYHTHSSSTASTSLTCGGSRSNKPIPACSKGQQVQNAYDKLHSMVGYWHHARGYVPYPAHTHTCMYHAHFPSTTSNPLTWGGLRSNTSTPACTSQNSRCKLHMGSSSTRLGVEITWICAVSSSHAHLHVPCT